MSENASDLISIDEFGRVDLRVARILEAERVPNTAKLVKLKVDVGSDQLQLVAGIAEAYEADSLIGKTIIVVANLKPAKLRGVESQGMLLAATPESGQPILATFDAEVAPGSKVR